MKIREICNRHRFTAADIKVLNYLGNGALSERLIKSLADEFGLHLVIGSPSLLANEFEPPKRRQRKRQVAAGPGGIGSPPKNEVAGPPSADAGAADAAGPAVAAPIAVGGPTLG
jgi:hypothetical protein